MEALAKCWALFIENNEANKKERMTYMKLKITFWQHVNEELLQNHGLSKEDLISVLEDEDIFITEHIRELAVVVAEVIGSYYPALTSTLKEEARWITEVLYRMEER